MTNTEKILEECRKKFGGKVGWIGAGGAPGGNLTGLADKEIELFLATKIAQTTAEEKGRMRGEIRKRRDSLSISTTFAVMMMSQRGDAGKMAKELRELGGYQALDDLLNSPDK